MYTTTLICLALAAGASGERELIDRIVAVVNDDIITLSDVQAAAQPYAQQNDTPDRKDMLYRDVLDQLINERLLSQQVQKAQIDVTDDEVERAIEDILKQNNISRAELEQAIRQRGMSMGQYREDLESQLVRLKIVDMKVRSRVVIPESEIRAEYERRTKDEEREQIVRIRHLFFRWGESPDPEEKARVMARARAARERVVAGEDFAEVAQEVSEGPTAAQGGDLGELSEKGLLPELATALKGLDPGDITPPVETSNGVHVVVLEDRRSKAQTEYAEVRDRIYQELYQRKVEEQMKIWLDELRAESAVDVRL